jgi:flagellar basal-body rod protein FlgB
MDNGFRILEKMVYAAQVRHKLLSSNIANTDTPKYRAKDVDFKSFIEDASASLKATDPRHMQAPAGSAGPSGSLNVTESQSWGDDNNVELDMEVAKMTENGLLYETAVKLMSTKMRMIKNALGRR